MHVYALVGEKLDIRKNAWCVRRILIASDLGSSVLFCLVVFGGVVRDVCELLQDNKCSDSLTEQWQSSCNKGYRELLQRYNKGGS